METIVKILTKKFVGIKKLHIFAPQYHSNGCNCDTAKMAGHSPVTCHSEAVKVDYLGNNRMVVNKNGTVEQITHYYPYGGVIGDISTNENLQKYKFEGKELDRTFGLDNYDIHARQYFAMMPTWNRIDPLAEKYYGISPYSYCGGDPINWMDYDGEYIYSVDPITGEIDKTGEFDDYDEIQIVGSNSTMRIEHVNGKSILEGIEGNGEGTTTSVESSSSQLLDAFFFLADNTEYEWSMQVGNKSGKDLFVLGTSRKEGSVESGKIASRHGIMNNTWLNMHSHPDEIDGTPGGSVGDMGNFQLSYKNESEAPLHIVYHNGIAHLYNGNHSSLSGWEKKRSDFELRTYRFWHNRQKRIPKSDGTKTTYINM